MLEATKSQLCQSYIRCAIIPIVTVVMSRTVSLSLSGRPGRVGVVVVV